MQSRLLIIALLAALGIGVSFASAGSGLLGGFFGVFLGVFVGYTFIIALSHFVCLVLPKFGIGTDPRNKEVRTR